VNPVLLLHGALGSAAQVQPFADTWLAERTALALHLPGHGGVAAEGAFSLPQFGHALLALLDEKGWARADIFGYSMGGYVALWLARHHPDRVGRVVTLGTKLHWTPDVASGMNRMFDAEKIAAKAPQLAAALEQTHGDWRLLCQRTAAFLHDLGAGAGLSESDFRQINCPVTIGWGDQDQVVSEAESRAVAEWLPKGQLVVVPGVPHLLEQTDAAVVRVFLQASL
jgi:pimeloyl-ACP methyl ester carboxylesterase